MIFLYYLLTRLSQLKV